MSYINTVVLSFNCDEFNDDESTEDCPVLEKINAWLKRRKFEPFTNLNAAGNCGSNAILYGNAWNHIDVDALLKFIGKQKWKWREDVKILLWGDESTTCDVHVL